MPNQNILFLAANPKDTARLRLDQELRDIGEGLQRAQKRDQFNLEQRWAVRPRDIQRAMLDLGPSILHFSGHGEDEAGLVFEDEIGNTKLVDGATLASLFELFADQLNCVVLNGCYTEVQAKAIAQHIPYVIGMNKEIGDKAAITFAVGFYDALGAGRDVEFAFNLGCTAIRMEGITEHLTPVLIKKPGPIDIFISYSHRDEALHEELVTHLSNLRRQGKIAAWHDRAIEAGEEWETQIKSKLESAQIILLLISPNFMASYYSYDVELERAIERHNAGTARVIPVILRPCDWQGSPFSKLQVLPKDAKPVTKWDDRDSAFLDVSKGLRRAIEQIGQTKKLTSETYLQPAPPPPSAVVSLVPLSKVFITAGIPTFTFVEPEQFAVLKLTVATPGMGVVIEGPSGIGKTTALEKAVEQIQADPLYCQNLGEIKKLSARRPQDIEGIKTINDWHQGIVVIDDFHRLDSISSQLIADYLKYLADTQAEDRKVVIIGIPRTGQKLIDISWDLTGRIEIFSLTKVQPETIIKMICQGEEALNIVFTRKPEIAVAANGSLSIAQCLCRNLALKANIDRTQQILKIIDYFPDGAITTVMKNLTQKFGNSIRQFSLLGGRLDWTSIEILQELAQSEDGFCSLIDLQDKSQDIARRVKNFLHNQNLDSFYKTYPEISQFLYYDREIHELVIDDPQLTFYLLNTPPERLRKLAGKIESNPRTKVFISYAHNDAKIGVDVNRGINQSYFERLRVHLIPLEQEGIIDLWDDTKIQTGSLWRKDIEKALSSAKVALLLVSGHFLASEFIQRNELPQLLADAKEAGLIVIPIMLSPARLPATITEIQAANSPAQPLTAMDYNQQEELFSDLAKYIEESLIERN